MKPFAQYLVSKGWIYFQIDNRGSANRGRAFEDQIYHAMGTVEVEDQMLGERWLKAQPFVDPGAIAIYGWSYGGYMKLKLLRSEAHTSELKYIMSISYTDFCLKKQNTQ